jgi:hypothetical protein
MDLETGVYGIKGISGNCEPRNHEVSHRLPALQKFPNFFKTGLDSRPM